MNIQDATPIILTEEERAVLESMVRSPKTEQGVSERARMVLLAADGRSTRSIAAALGTWPGRVSRWRTRFAAERLAGLSDRARPGGRRTVALKVTNKGDRPVQIGSHFHFFEVNRAVAFDRAKTFGMRLDVPAGTAVRFEPGQSKRVTLVELGGTGEVVGLNRLTDGSTRSDRHKEQALQRARDKGFEGA